MAAIRISRNNKQNKNINTYATHTHRHTHTHKQKYTQTHRQASKPYTTMEKVTNFLDSGYPLDVIYLDFQKAFDKVPHKRLLMKL